MQKLNEKPLVYEEQRQCECEDWKLYMEIAEQMK